MPFRFGDCPNFPQPIFHFIYVRIMSAENNSLLLAIFRPISIFGQLEICFDWPSFPYIFNGTVVVRYRISHL